MAVPPLPGGSQPEPPAARTNRLAVASLVCAFLAAPFGVVLGHMSLARIRRTGERGQGVATAGLIVGYLLTAVTTIAVVLALVYSGVALHTAGKKAGPPAVPSSQAPSATTTPPPPAAPDGALPAFDPPSDLGSNCQYPLKGTPAKTTTTPRSGPVPREPATVSASITTDRGNIGLELANGQAPCTVNNFASLAQQGYFDGTACHRLTTGSLSVLQCGDPEGTGVGGPGYQFADEYPVNQTHGSEPVTYPRGTLAMANAGPDTNGSQFFMVYQDSQLPPQYTVFGTIDATGLETLDKIAAAGVAGGGSDGKPATPVTITSARLD